MAARGGNAESGWKHYAERDYLAGIFYWTGFDYRGESTPYGFPAVGSQFGINTLLIKAKPFPVWQDREGLFQFHPARFAFYTAAGVYQRKLFNGWAQVIIQSTKQAGLTIPVKN